jgi:hypothetical protein
MTAYAPVSIRKLRALISAAPAPATPPTIEELRAGMENRGAANPPARDIRSGVTDLSQCH